MIRINKKIFVFIKKIQHKLVETSFFLNNDLESGAYLNLNLYSLYLIITKPKFRNAYYEAKLINVDGIGATVIIFMVLSKWYSALGYKYWACNYIIKNKEKSFFLFGGTEQENSNAVSNLSSDLEISINGIEGYSSNFKKEMIQLKQADIVFVGVGMPKQELLILDYLKTIQSNKLVLFSCGGWIKQAAGLERSVPSLFALLKLEWIYRSFSREGHLKTRVLLPITKVIKFF